MNFIVQFREKNSEERLLERLQQEEFFDLVVNTIFDISKEEGLRNAGFTEDRIRDAVTTRLQAFLRKP